MSFLSKVKDAKDAAETRIREARTRAEENQARRDEEDTQRLKNQEDELDRLEKKLALRKRVQDTASRVRELEATTTLKGRIMRGLGNKLSEAVAPKDKRKKP